MRKRILIVAKTYPYGELVCTAGIDEQGKWHRLYPVPFRNLTKEHRYKKYQWVEVELEKDTSDPRLESCKIISFHIESVKIADSASETYKLPFRFYYKFDDNEGRVSRLQIIDWEIGELTRKLLTHYGNNYNLIKDILRHKYFTAMQKRDVYLFLGTNREWHIRKSPNPFMIIGIFYPPLENNLANLQIENKSFTNIPKTNLLESYAVKI